MVFRVNEGEKFACVAFTNVSLEPPLVEQVPLYLGEGAWVLDRPHFDLPANWKTWIGSIEADRVSRSNLLLLVKRESEKPDILDHENKKLLSEVDALFYGLLLQGMPQHLAAYRFTGAVSQGESTIRQFSEAYYHHAYSNKTPVSPDTCKVAKTAAEGIKETISKTEFLRIQRGFKALIDATRARFGEDALHQFVRAIDALILPRVGNSKRDFAHRCQTFTVANEAHRTILEDIYDVRSNVEHMHEWNGATTAEDAKRDDHLLRQMVCQIETLALSVYLKIMTSNTHRDIFRSNAGIESFWLLPDDQKKNVWGLALDLGAIPNTISTLEE
jgi:hypothetical protein